jgi:hypothetical protein
MTFDHELKIRRAFDHLHELDGLIKAWLDGSHHSVRQERDPKTGGVAVLATAEQPPVDPWSLLIGDSLHNLRSALDALAFALAGAYTKPLPDDIAESSEFPIFGDEDRQGNTGVGSTRFHKTTKKGDPAPGSGLVKIRGWDQAAQAILEGLQPYHRGNVYRSHPLWILHELDRINKHRVLHTTVMHFSGFMLDLNRTRNVHQISAGQIEVFEGTIEADTPIARLPPLVPLDPNREMHMEVQPAIKIAFAPGTPCVDSEPVLETLWRIYMFVGGDVVPALRPFL